MTKKIDTDDARYRMKLQTEMMNHIGAHNAIGMGELFQEVWGGIWEHRINDTRALRRLITELRAEGVPICSVSDKSGGGYYLAAAGSELTQYLRRSEVRALKILMRNARIKKVSLPNYLGQIKLNMEAES
jgi:hypothetical protein